jgi:hypothetical protein
MTSDRELLERAAKAAGYDFRGGETFKRPGIEALTYIAGGSCWRVGVVEPTHRRWRRLPACGEAHDGRVRQRVVERRRYAH